MSERIPVNASKTGGEKSSEAEQPLEELLSQAASLQHRSIAQRAHQIFLERGGASGDDLRDWLQAKQELLGHLLL